MDGFSQCQGFSGNARRSGSHLIWLETSQYHSLGVSLFMTLVINGEARTCPAVANVRDLVLHLGIGQDRVAVEVNGRIAKRRDWESTPVADHDRIEIVQFVGGG